MPTNPGTTDLVEWFELNEAGGNRTGAHAGTTLTDNATVLYGTGIQGNAADFDGTVVAERLTLGSGSALHFGDEDWTWVVWVKAEGLSGNPGIINNDGNGVASGYRIDFLTSTGAFRAFVMNGGVAGIAQTTESVSTGTWYMVAAWHDATANEIGVQIAGQPAHTAATTKAAAQNAGDWVMGARQTTGWYNGLIDEASAWSRVLTDDEIAWLYNAGAGRTYAELSGGSALPIIMQAHAAAGWR